MPIEFTKHLVLKYIEEISDSPPTPTDEDHPADWWNEQFGSRIKQSFKEAMEQLTKRIDILKEL